ncbi:MAG: sugar transferase [Chloroflexi bacterium]|nr:sugar transferase [Chloroflexota bacterium]
MNDPSRPISRRQWQLAERRFLLVVGDVLAVLLAVLIALVVWVMVDRRGLEIDFIVTRAYWFPVLAGLWLMIASANDFYHLRIASQLDTTLTRLVQITLQLLAIYGMFFFLSPRGVLPRLFILYYGVLSFVLILIWRMLKPSGWVQARRVMIIGVGKGAAAIIDMLRHEALHDYEIVGQLSEPGGDLPDRVRRESISEIILAYEGELSRAGFQAVLDCYEQGVNIISMPLLYEQIAGRVPVEYLTPQDWAALLPAEGDAVFTPYSLVKRAMDVVLALLGLVSFTALLLVIIPAQWLDSPGPIFFRQARVGRGGKVFRVIKLRSMIPDAERASGPLWAAPDDPRITRVGRLLRRARLDEVPQLINVLRGEMSLIGPRPERPEFVDQLSQTIPFYRARHAVRPGITGWAQVCYSYGSSPDDAQMKLQYDLYYIRHRSLALDLLILFRTAGKMLALRGR